MQKALAAVIAAGLTAPVLATNGDIIQDAQAYLQRQGVDISSIDLNLTQADLEYYLNHPEQLIALVESLWQETTTYASNLGGLDGLSLNRFDGFKASSVPYANDPAYFSGYSSGEVYDLYEEAYPGYHQAMANYQRKPSTSSGSGLGLGGLGGLGGASFQNIGGLNLGNMSNLGGGLGGLLNTYPGYTSQAEFNDIVFDE